MKIIKVFAFLLTLFILPSCDASLCDNQLIEEISSPDGKYIASIFERNCGATTPYIRVVSIRLSATKFAPEDDNRWVFTIHDQSSVKASWLAAEKLEVSYSPTRDQPTQRKKWKDVLVSYKRVP